MKQYNLDIDNHTLVMECRNGDKDAMSILYTRFAPRMLHVIRRYVPNQNDAYDILHDGFIAAFTRLDSLKDPERMEYWLATIMKNLSLKFLQEQNLTSILNEIPEVMDELDIDELIDMNTLESLIKQLPDGYQKVFRLAVLENKSHKEISKILGIAPNTSSSQLFHAKIQLRKLIAEYKYSNGLLSVLIILCISGLFLYHYQNPAIKLPHIAPASQKPAINMATLTLKNIQNIKQPASISAIQPIDSTTQKESSINDNRELVAENSQIEDNSPSIRMDSTGYPLKLWNQDLLYADALPGKSKSKGWSAGIMVDPGIYNSARAASGISADSNQGGQSNDSQDQDGTSNNQQKMAPRNNPDIADYLSDKAHRNHHPISFGLTLEKHLSSWLGIETGISYTYLRTDFEDISMTSTCHWHYLDIPLKANLYVYKADRFNIYGTVGGKFSIPVCSYADVNRLSTYSNLTGGSFKSNCDWALGGGVGVSFRLSERIGIYIEPTIQYHFPHNDKVPNIWTDDPWSISLPIGFRFNW